MGLSRIDIMVDLETLGLTPKNPLIQLAAVAFDIETGQVLGNINIPIFSNQNENVNMPTLRWWMKTDPALLADLLNSGTSTEREALMAFRDFVEAVSDQYVGHTNATYLWGNGILFDNHILKEKMEEYGLDWPLNYRNDRDVRTIVDLYLAKTGGDYDTLKAATHEGQHDHNAYDDCLSQIKMVTLCFNELISS